MKAKFIMCEEWAGEDAMKMLKERKLAKGVDMEPIVAVLNYPTFQLELMAWRGDGSDPCYGENEDNSLTFDYFACIKGKANENNKELAEEDGMLWTSDDYSQEEVTIDFCSPTWKEELEREMQTASEKYIREKGYTFDKANF